MPMVKIQDSRTGEYKTVDIDEEALKSIEKINESVIDEKQISSFIGNLNVPAEVKVILSTLLEYTMKIGDAIVNLGKKILEIVIFFIKKYPNTIAGTLIGFVIGSIIASIPVVGWALGWLIVPLFTALGAVKGFEKDINNNTISNDMKEYMNEIFGSFKNIKTV